MSQTQTPTWTTGDRLRKARQIAGIESRDMADRLGVSRNTITNWEHDKTQPTLATFRVFAEETGADLAWLLGIEDQSSRSSCIIDDGIGQLELFANSSPLVDSLRTLLASVQIEPVAA